MGFFWDRSNVHTFINHDEGRTCCKQQTKGLKVGCVRNGWMGRWVGGGMGGWVGGGMGGWVEGEGKGEV